MPDNVQLCLRDALGEDPAVAWTPTKVPMLPSPRLNSMWISPQAIGLMSGQP